MPIYAAIGLLNSEAEYGRRRPRSLGVIVSSGIGGLQNWSQIIEMHERGDEINLMFIPKSSFKHEFANILYLGLGSRVYEIVTTTLLLPMMQ